MAFNPFKLSTWDSFHTVGEADRLAPRRISWRQAMDWATLFVIVTLAGVFIAPLLAIYFTSDRAKPPDLFDDRPESGLAHTFISLLKLALVPLFWVIGWNAGGALGHWIGYWPGAFAGYAIMNQGVLLDFILIHWDLRREDARNEALHQERQRRLREAREEMFGKQIEKRNEKPPEKSADKPPGMLTNKPGDKQGVQ